MPILKFPDPKHAGPEGIVAIGGDLHPDSLKLAYSQGIFPWPVQDLDEVPWFCPEERGVLFFDELHIPRSLERARKKLPFTFTLNKAFPKVIRGCALAKRSEQSGLTWITKEMEEAYVRLHQEGWAHSAEAWDGEELVGGIYGVSALGAFAGESMFHLKPYASKLALLHLIDHLKSRGLQWLDIQVMTDHMKALGARLIPRNQFLKLLRETQHRRLRLF